MYKIISLLLLLVITLPSYADCKTDKQPPKNIDFIYIHGSNDNTEKQRQSFYECVECFHPYIMKAFNSSSLANKLLLKNGQYKISSAPYSFYWGNQSKESIDAICERLDLTKLFSPRITQKVRSMFAHCMHDAIWVRQYKNMKPVIANLHKIVMEKSQQGEDVVLFGYSAGTFVTYEYLLHKLPIFDKNVFFEGIKNENDKKLLETIDIKPTCLDAILESKLMIISWEGSVIVDPSSEDFSKKMELLNTKTQCACVPQGTVKGIVNFGSPFILFYSDINAMNSTISEISKYLIKYVIENNMFWLTVNYKEDPLAIPTAKNPNLSYLKTRPEFINIRPDNGFVYDKSDVRSHRTFFKGHLAYWHTPKIFAKGMIKAYEEGYHYFYGQ